MLIKDGEARDYTCPFLGRKDSVCKGSRCMAWRWLHTADIAHHDRRGYCGAAGGLKF
jgi:hypothetical protein